MGTAYLFPVVDIRDIDSSPHDIGQRRPGSRQCGFDVLQGLDCLRVRIAHADNLSIRTGCRRAGDLNPGPYSHCPRVANNWLPRSAGRYVDPFQCSSSGLETIDLNAVKDSPVFALWYYID